MTWHIELPLAGGLPCAAGHKELVPACVGV